MTTLSIPDMTCGHCKAAVTQALTALDPGAKVEIDLTARTARVDSPTPPAEMIAALDRIGFPANLAG